MNTYSEDKMYEKYSNEVERMQRCINELLQENKQLKIQISAREEVCDRLESNWNKLKEYTQEKYDNPSWASCGARYVLEKMQELQGSDSNE